MSIRWFIAVMIVSAACGEPTNRDRSSPADAEVFLAADAEPTEKQKKALANPLHVAHIEADEPVQCRECHSIQGERRATEVVKHRCLSCHEENTSAVHATVANDDARECLSCHEFWASEADPWACTDCHQPNGAPRGGPAPTNGDARHAVVAHLVTQAPGVEVHEEECQACHVPHGEEALAPKTCFDCHEDTSEAPHTEAHHASADPRGRTSLAEPDQCLECHGGHEAAAAAAEGCLACHGAEVPPSRAIFEGHDRCVTCHTPHEGTGKKACQSCHERKPTVAAAKSAAHRDCASCHRPHTARWPSGCKSCHDTLDEPIDPKHPADEQRGECAGCHPQHPIRDALRTAQDCTACHQEAKVETGFHAGTECRQCHEPHAFDLEKAGAGLCASCHVGEAPRHPRAQAGKIVKPAKGHDECSECHPKANHTPALPKSDCGRCHEDQKEALQPVHGDCQSCHPPHEAVPNKDCASCHQEKVVMGRHAPKLSDCDSCHSIHSLPPQEPTACIECHERPLPLLHGNDGHQECADCHGFHDVGKRGDRKSCIEGCHDELVDHEPTAKRCTGCHPFEQAPKEVWR